MRYQVDLIETYYVDADDKGHAYLAALARSNYGKADHSDANVTELEESVKPTDEEDQG